MRTLKRSECAVLHLVLKRKWYDMIASGEKREEYRDATPYWNTRIRKWAFGGNGGREHVVEFRQGYAKDAPRMAFTLGPLYYPKDATRILHFEWGEPHTSHFVIGLREQVKLED